MRHSLLRCLPVLALAASCSGGDSAVTAGPPGSSTGALHVAADAAPGGDGTSWSSAYRNLGEALARARDGDAIWVAAGTYRPAEAGGDRNAAFALRSGVSVYGGFAGDEGELAQRDPAAHRVILSGDLNGDDGPAFENSAENVYQVVVAVDVTGARLDGVTVRGGRADGPGFGPSPRSREQGSGINVYGGSIEVRGVTIERCWSLNHGAVNDHSEGSLYVDCLFVDNYARTLGAGLYLHHETSSEAMGCTFLGNGTPGDGGGAYTRSMHGARFHECRFESNRALQGAGLYHAAGSATHVEACTFVANHAGRGGGGIYADLAEPSIVDCLFEANDAGVTITDGAGGTGGSGGGGIWAIGGAASVRGCTFRGNEASFGAGFYAIHDARAALADCVFEDNSANEAGGIYVLFSPVLIERCTFERNEAKGGSFSVGGAISNYYSDATIQECVFRDNSAQRGGGAVYDEGEDPWIERCRFERNRTFGDDGFGGGIFNAYFTRARVVSSSFVGNWAGYGGGAFDLAFSEAGYRNCTFAANGSPHGAAIHAHEFAEPTFANCIVWGSGEHPVEGDPRFEYGLVEGGFAGEGNRDADPRFVRAPGSGPDGAWDGVDDDFGDLALRAGSPAIDAGANRLLPDGATLDLGGAARVVDDPGAIDTGFGRGPLVDQGCFERGS